MERYTIHDGATDGLRWIKGYKTYRLVDSEGNEKASIFAIVGSCNRETGRYGYSIGDRVVFRAKYIDLKDLASQIIRRVTVSTIGAMDSR